MTIAELCAQIRALPFDIGEPFRDRTWFRQHTAAHLVGGPLWWVVGSFFWFDPASLKAWLFAVAATAIRQGFMNEAKGWREFPLYGMLWDTVTSAIAAGAAMLLFRRFG